MIYCDKSVAEALKTMPIMGGFEEFDNNEDGTHSGTNIILHNIQGLLPLSEPKPVQLKDSANTIRNIHSDK